MDKSAALEKLRDLLEQEFDIQRAEVNLDSLLYEDLELDSIDAVDLMAWVTKITGKRVNAEDFKDARTVDDVISKIIK